MMFDTSLWPQRFGVRVQSLLAILIVVLFPQFGSGASSAPGPDSNLWTNWANIRKFEASGAAQGASVHLQGVVTFVDTNRGRVFLHDGTAQGLVLVDKDTVPTPSEGSWLELEARMEVSGEYAVARATRMTVLGTAPLPAPVGQSVQRILTMHGIHQWVSVQGIVRSVRQQGGRLMISLANRGRLLRAELCDIKWEQARALEGAEVIVTGACAFESYPPEAEAVPRLFLSTLDQVSRIHDAPHADSLPVLSPGDVLKLSPDSWGEERRRVRGVVTMHHPGFSVYIQRGESAIFVMLKQPYALKVGDTVDAIGYPSLWMKKSILTDAEIIPASPEPVPVPFRFDIGKQQPLAYDGRVVSLIGRVLGKAPHQGGIRLTLRAVEDAKTLVSLIVMNDAGGSDGELFKDLALRSIVQATGVLTVISNPFTQTSDMGMFIPSVSAVKVLEDPPWSSGDYFRLAAFLGVVALAILACFVVQRIQLRRQKQIERDLRRSERQLQDVLETTSSPVFMLDLEGRFLRVNSQWEVATGLKRHDVIGTHVRAHFSPGTTCRIEQDYDEALGRFSAFHSEECPVLSGGDRYYLSVCFALRDSEGKPYAVCWMATDITQRRLMEQNLRQSEERFRSLTEAITEVFWEADHPITRTLYVSPAYERIWGRTCASLYANPKSFMDAIHPEDRDSVIDALAVKRRGIPYHHEYRIVRPDGEVRWIWDRGYPLLSSKDQTVSRYVGVAVDITEQRKWQAAATAAEKLAATGRMAARIAHEINNPLAGIRNAFELIKPSVPAEADSHRFLSMVEREIERITRIVKQMFIVYKPEAEKPDHLIYDEILSDAAELMRAKAHRKGITIEIAVRDQPIQGFQIRGYLMQIVLNLLNNALDASPPDKPVRLNLYRSDQLVNILVCDSGGGIPESVRPRLFEPFFSTKTDAMESGMGLGLSVSRSLAEAMSGTLEYASDPQQGTQFRLTVPLIAVPQLRP